MVLLGTEPRVVHGASRGEGAVQSESKESGSLLRLESHRQRPTGVGFGTGRARVLSGSENRTQRLQ